MDDLVEHVTDIAYSVFIAPHFTNKHDVIYSTIYPQFFLQ